MHRRSAYRRNAASREELLPGERSPTLGGVYNIWYKGLDYQPLIVE